MSNLNQDKTFIVHVKPKDETEELKDTSRTVDKQSKKQMPISHYKKGMEIYGLTIDKIYFSNADKKFIILKAVKDNDIHVFGGNLSEIEDLLAECKYLTKSIKVGREEFDYQRAIAMNCYLLGKTEQSKKILRGLIKKLQERCYRQVLLEKFWQIILPNILYIITICFLYLSTFIPRFP